MGTEFEVCFWNLSKIHFCYISLLPSFLNFSGFQDGVIKKMGQVGAILHKTQIMTVNGFHGNKELSYFYSTSKIANFFHRSKRSLTTKSFTQFPTLLDIYAHLVLILSLDLDGDVIPYERCVLKKDFAQHFKEGIQVEQIVDEEICFLEEEEDNFAIAIRINFHFSENLKVFIYCLLNLHTIRVFLINLGKDYPQCDSSFFF